MSKSIVVVHLEDVEPHDGERPLAGKSIGSDRIGFGHATYPAGVEAKGIVYNGHDELVYVLKGKCEIEFDGKTEIAGPGTLLFVPDGSSYDFKVLEELFELLAALSPPRD